MSDKEIIAAYREGRREEAFNWIVKNYSERLYWHVRRFLGSHEDADDLLQDVFIKIWTALPFFRGEAQLYTWLYRIATNEALNFLGKQKTRAKLSSESLSEELERKVEDDPWFNGDEAERELSKAIMRLPEKQRLVFQMRYYDDMSYEEISKILDTSVGALKASYHFAFNKIKEALKKTIE